MDRILYRSRVISILFLVMGMALCSTHGWAFGPTVTDVTTRSFSVVWTEDVAVTSTSAEAYEPTVLQDGTPVSGDQVEINLVSDQDALDRGIIKFEVIGLDYNTYYTYSGSKRIGTYSGDVTTEKFRGLISTDPNDHDIVTNDIVHVPVYLDNPGDTNGTNPDIPALGVLVMAEIYSDAACTANNRLSDHPITAWVGDGMPGDPTLTSFTNKTFDPVNVCFSEFAALNLNNLFGSDRFPLQLEGDIAGTPQVEGEYIKVTVITGCVNNPTENLERIMPVPEITKVGSQKISSAKVGAKVVFRSGINTFIYPYEIPEGFTMTDLMYAIHGAGGKIKKIRWWTGSSWTGVTLNFGVLGPYPLNIQPISPGQGYLVILETAPQNFYICNSPTPTSFTLRKGINFLNFTQVPDFYTVKDLQQAIHAAGGTIKKIRWWTGSYWTGVTLNFGQLGPYPLYNHRIKRGNAYLVILDSTGSGNPPPPTITVDPLSR